MELSGFKTRPAFLFYLTRKPAICSCITVSISGFGKQRKKALWQLQSLAMFSIFTDDLAAINDGGEFKKALCKMFPPELELRKENISPFEASFLSEYQNLE